MKFGKKKKPRDLPCGICHGTGWVPVSTPVSRHAKKPSLVHRRCYRCNGSGRV